MRISNCICGKKMHTVEEDGKFFIECARCGKSTEQFPTREQAVDAWESVIHINNIDDNTFKEM